MEISIFEYQDYKKYLRDLIRKSPLWRRGGRLKLAEAMGCGAGYVTQVLNKDANLSLEQAEKLCRVIGLSSNEVNYFLLLVNSARAGSAQLRNIFREQIDRIISQRVNLKDKIKPEEILSQESQAVYYSSWQYAAIHMLCTIPSFEMREAISERLAVPKEKISEILDFLESVGLIERSKGQTSVTSKRIFVDKDSVFNYRHHVNFRQLAMSNLDKFDKTDFHYSGAHSLSLQDSAKIIEIIRESIFKSRQLIKDSPEEDLFGFNIDFFKL